MKLGRTLAQASRWLRAHHQPQPVVAWAVALGLPVLVFLATMVVFRDDATPPFFLFILPVAFAAWLAGLRYGLAAIVVSSALMAYGFRSPAVAWEMLDALDYGRLIGWVLVALVVTALFGMLRDAYQELMETSERFRLAQESARVWSWEMNPQSGEILWSSPQAEVLHRGRYPSLLDRVHPEDRAMVERAIAEGLRERSGFALEFRVLAPENEVHWVLSRGVVFEAAGRPTRIIGVNADITARKRAEQAQVAAARGQMAAELAHQINNPLEMLISSLYLLENSFPRQEQSRVYLDAAREGAARVSQLVRELLHLYPRRQAQ